MKRVVVTGLGAVTPVGNNVPDMWQSVKDGVCGIDFIKKFNTDNYPAKVGAEVKDFDPLKDFAKRDLRRTDLYTQYAVAAAQQAVEDSGIESSKNIDPERLGVYVGTGIGGMDTFVKNAVNLENKGVRQVSPFFIPMMIGNIASGNIAIRFNAKGVCLPVVTACATGTHSIGEAFHAIKHGYADAIITGGAEATITPLALAGFSNMKALSTNENPKEACIPFDKRRDGFVMGEGSGVLVLEEYEHAKKRNAKIYGELIGYGNSCDAHHITAPDPNAQGPAQAIKTALTEANVNKDKDNIYFNAHGTSTVPNDASETKALKIVLGEKAYDINISSTKSMTGHMLGAAGGVEAIISLLALQEGIIPPTIGYEVKDEECDLNYTPNTAVKKDINIAVSNNLGFGGHNGCIVFKKI